MPRGKYSNLSVRREVREELDKLRAEVKINDLSDLLTLLVNTYREHTNTVSKFEEVLTNAVSKAVKEALGSYTSTVSTSPSTHTNTVSKSRPSGKATAWDILKRDKITCAGSMRVKNPSRVIDSLFENGAVRIDLGSDVCVVEPEYGWRFWDTLDKLKTPNDEENVKELKDEAMKWLYTVLRKEGILVLDSNRKPPVWTVDKRVEIPEKAFEAGESS